MVWLRVSQCCTYVPHSTAAYFRTDTLENSIAASSNLVLYQKHSVETRDGDTNIFAGFASDQYALMVLPKELDSCLALQMTW